MKFSVLSCIVLFFCWVLISPCLSSDQEPIPRQSVQADFIQEKHLKILVRPIISTGTFVFQAPQSLRWEYQTPVPSVLLMHGGQLRKFIARDGQLVEDQGMGLDSIQVVLAQISNWLDGRFSESDMFSVSFVDEHTVLLIPKGQALAGMISTIELRLTEQKGLLKGVTIFEGPESFTRMTFSNTLLNKAIPVSLFTQK